MILPLLLALVVGSQPPPPSTGEPDRQPQAEQAKPAQPQPTPPERGTPANPFFVQPVRNQDEAADDRADRLSEQSNRRYSLFLSGVTVVVLGFQIWLLVNQNVILRSQSAIMSRQERSAASTAALSKTALDIATTQSEINALQLATNREIERAYIAMSSKKFFFVELKSIKPYRENHPDPDTFEVVVELKNVGRTPGTIVGGWCGLLHRPIAPGEPKMLPDLYSGTTLCPVFVRPTDAPLTFALHKTLSKKELLFLRRGEPADGATAAEGEEMPTIDRMGLWLAGEIDYRDRFNQFHRTGFGTRWDRRADRFVVDPSISHLNYDRPLTEDEVKKREYAKGEGERHPN